MRGPYKLAVFELDRLILCVALQADPAHDDALIAVGLRDRMAQLVSTVPSLFSLPRDPDDEPYLNLAIAADADHLVTWDKDMLDLMQDQGFRAQYPQLTILNPVALLEILRRPSEQQP